MKAESTIRREIRRLRNDVIQNAQMNDFEQRIAYAMECALLWALENGREPPCRAAFSNARAMEGEARAAFSRNERL